MPGSDYNDEEKNRQPKTNVLEEGGERGREGREVSEGVKAQVCREEVRKGKGEKGRQAGLKTGAADESHKKGGWVLGRKGGCQFKPVQALNHHKKIKVNTPWHWQRGPPNGHPWQLELELHRVQLNSYTLDNLSFAGEIQIYLHGNIQLHAVEENSTFARVNLLADMI